MLAKGAKLHGGCSLFRLYELRDAKAWQAKLGQHHIWSRIFPYSKSFLRLGLPAQSHWARIEKALSSTNVTTGVGLPPITSSTSWRVS